MSLPRATSRPFRRLPFDSLPETPRVPHPYFETPAHELTMSSVPFGRMRVHYRELGKGPPLLLVHGLMTSGYSFRYVLRGLAAHYRVIVPDLPGAGRTDKPVARRYGARELATWIREIVVELGVRGCRAIGNSMGGYLCLRAALDEPRIFGRLAIVHAPGVPEPRLHALEKVLAIPGARRALAWWVRRAPEAWAHRNVHYYDETLKSLEEAREYGRPLATEEGARAFVAHLAEALAPRDMAELVATLAARRDRGETFPIPLLLLYADRDPIVPAWVGDRFRALIPDARFVRLAHSSHFAHVDSPERFLPPVLDFLSD